MRLWPDAQSIAGCVRLLCPPWRGEELYGLPVRLWGGWRV
jgi:hypothetical protein